MFNFIKNIYIKKNYIYIYVRVFTVDRFSAPATFAGHQEH